MRHMPRGKEDDHKSPGHHFNNGQERGDVITYPLCLSPFPLFPFLHEDQEKEKQREARNRGEKKGEKEVITSSSLLVLVEDGKEKKGRRHRPRGKEDDHKSPGHHFNSGQERGGDHL
jgi:hypothetical protein